MEIDSFQDFSDLPLPIQFFLIDVEQLLIVVDQVLADVRLTGGAGKVGGFKSVHSQQSWTPDGSQVVVGHQVLGTHVGDGVQVADQAPQGLVVEAG